ncbi:hypothetical protein ABH924_004320, partial [Arthrobacter sp. GAS37]
VREPTVKPSILARNAVSSRSEHFSPAELTGNLVLL